MSQLSTGLNREEKRTGVRKAVPGGPPIAVDAIEAARLLSISVSSLYALLRQGELENFYSGKSRRIPVRAIEDYVARQLSANGTQARRPRKRRSNQQPELQDG
jgi:excisionase family DNA binding protein